MQVITSFLEVYPFDKKVFLIAADSRSVFTPKLQIRGFIIHWTL